MSAQTVIVIPGRYGDLINILPCARDIALKEGGKCAVMVSADFASVLEGCSYVEPVVISSHFTDIQPAIEQARAMFARVLVAKVNEKSVGVTTQCQSFNEESWRQIGYLDRWWDLPLVFDRRDGAREQDLLKRFVPEAPIGLFNFSGKSAPLGDDGWNWLERNRNRLPKVFKWLNIGNSEGVTGRRIYDLLAIMDRADVLVTGDTSTLHLAAASGVPVVNLIGDQPTRWHGSKPRNNTVCEIRYREIYGEIPNLKFGWKPRTWHVWSDYAMGGETLRRHQLARSTWPRTWIDFPVKENRRVLQDPMRSLPFVKDLVNAAVNCSGPRDAIVLTNADTCVASDAAQCVDEAVKEFGCCYCFRRDFASVNQAMNRHEVRGGRQYPGCDLFAFTVQWWKENERRYPDLLLGAETWDWCLRVMMMQSGGGKFNDLIFHEIHRNQWEDPDYRHSLPSQMHNRGLAAPFLAGQGVAFK